MLPIHFFELVDKGNAAPFYGINHSSGGIASDFFCIERQDLVTLLTIYSG
jgi:hypothetical protein